MAENTVNLDNYRNNISISTPMIMIKHGTYEEAKERLNGDMKLRKGEQFVIVDEEGNMTDMVIGDGNKDFKDFERPLENIRLQLQRGLLDISDLFDKNDIKFKDLDEGNKKRDEVITSLLDTNKKLIHSQYINVILSLIAIFMAIIGIIL